MKIAIISDIHGNIDALNAVLKKLENKEIDQYIFTGDYNGDLPYLNEVINKVKETDGFCIKGNRDDYILNLSFDEIMNKPYKHFKALYWNEVNLTKDNHRFLSQLPDSLDLKIEDINILVSHGLEDFIDHPETRKLSSSYYSLMYQNKSKDEFLRELEVIIDENDDLKEMIRNLSGDVFIFGHSHVQWYFKYDGKLFINAGSCGMPLDLDYRAPYVIIDTNDLDYIELGRAEYDVSKMIESVKKSEFYYESPEWIDMVLRQIKSGNEEINFFFTYAMKRSNGEFPIPDDIYESSYNSWIDEDLESFYREYYLLNKIK